MSLTITGPVWHSHAGDTPAAVADVFRQAAKLIQAEGYAPCADGIHVDRATGGTTSAPPWTPPPR
jgi:hypothetical protein